MGFLDNITGTKKNDPLTQAKENIAMMDRQLQEKIYNLGHFVFTRSEAGEEVDPIYSAALQQIKQVKANRQAYYANWLQLQGLMECVNCHKQIPYGSVFCSYCGNKTTEKTAEAPAVEEEVANVCTNCGTQMEKDAVFCTSCGTKRVSND